MARVSWTESGTPRSALWLSENETPPTRLVVSDDRLRADDAYRLASQGTAILWRGDFQNARQLLQALARRIDRNAPKTAPTLRESFHLVRQAQALRARILGKLLLPFEADYSIPLRRAPDVRQACVEAFGPVEEPSVASVRALLGAIGAHEWRKKGIEVAALGARIHPHYGVFAPIRQEYVELVARAPLPSGELAFDIGTGTGVLAALLARRGVKRVIAADRDERSLACARENIARLSLDETVQVVQADLFPGGTAPLIVCNPPWLPARPSSTLEAALYDDGSRMLRGFIAGVGSRLQPGGEAWLVLSDIAERLGLRTRDELLALFEQAELQIVDRLDTKAEHPKARDAHDPLHAARAAEISSLWRLSKR
jgi:SAM-dependent methyltransferase